MKNEIFIKLGEQLTLGRYLPIASDTMSLIAEAAESVDEINETFSIADLAILLNKICVHMEGEFEVRRTSSGYYQIVYVPYVFNEVGFDEDYLLSNFTETHNASENRLWVNEKVLIAFIDQKLHGIHSAVYFYLGYLMTRDETFAISHNISFERILEGCDAFPKGFRVRHWTTLLRALADLEDAGLIKWKGKTQTFEILT